MRVNNSPIVSLHSQPGQGYIQPSRTQATMRAKRKNVSPDEHFAILQAFVESMLRGIYGSLLVNGESPDVASDTANYIHCGLSNPLNNPFKYREKEPVEYRLGQEHWLTFASLLRRNDHILMGFLINPPYDWTVEEAYYEWKWLVAELDTKLPKLSPKQDRTNIARLRQVKAAWDAAVTVRITVEVGDFVAEYIIADHRFNNESNVVLAKRGIAQMAGDLTDRSFKKIDQKT